MQICDKVFVVTGAASGLGAAVARLLVAEGGKVVLADVNPAGEAVAKELGAARFVATDVTSDEQGEAAVAAAVETFGASERPRQLRGRGAGREDSGPRRPASPCLLRQGDQYQSGRQAST